MTLPLSTAAGQRPLPPGLLFSLESAAAELATSPINVLRLIARGGLKATRLPGLAGAKGWRITAGNLADYVDSGAKDFAAPPAGRGWFLDTDVAVAEPFERRLLAAIGRDAPTAAALAAALKPGQDTIRWPLRITEGAVRRALAEKDNTAGAPDPSRFGLAMRAWAGARLRRAARQVIALGRYGDVPLVSLYASPSQYAEIVGLAAKRAALGDLSTTVPLAVAGRTAFASVFIPIQAILDAAAFAGRIAPLAF